MQAIKDMLGSERAVFALALIVGATVLTGMSLISPEEWIDFAKWIATIFIGSKTVTTAIEVWKASIPPSPPGAP
jgi:hypothetical protein